MKIISITTRITIKSSAKRMRNIFTTIPAIIENATKPFLYSFFSGLKRVWSKMGTERRWRTYTFKEPKNPRILEDIWTYQNKTKKIG